VRFELLTGNHPLIRRRVFYFGLFRLFCQAKAILLSGVVMRVAKPSDVGSVCGLTDRVRWNHSAEVIERFLSYEPEGCFVAEVEGQHVGNVFTVSFGKVGWIGLLIVDEKFRRRGIGTLLMRRGISYLHKVGVETMELEAVPEIADLYRKLGFVDEFDSLRFTKVNKINHPSESFEVRPMNRDELGEVSAFDFRYFGADRSRVLRSLLESSPELCFVSRSGRLIDGYVMSYGMKVGYRIGPWVCRPDSPMVARGLILKCMEAIGEGEKLFVGVPAVNDVAVWIMKELGFELVTKSLRMCLGKRIENQYLRGIFSIHGPENG